MRKNVLYCGLLALAGAAFLVGEAAGAWDLVASYATPTSNPRGYYAHPDGGWLVDDSEPARVLHVRWPSGSISASFTAPGGGGAFGVCRGPGGHLLVSNVTSSMIYETSTTGSVYNSFTCPVAGPADMTSGYSGNYACIAIPDANVLARVNMTTGSLVSTAAGPGARPTSCCGHDVGFVADEATHTIYLNGSPIITGVQTPVGVDELSTTDGTFLYVIDDATDYCYMYQSDVTVAPASLGRVRALFR
jgi:hypothetical protein